MYLSDMHTHSIASGHGTHSTISAMAKKASERGLKRLGITDHGPATMSAGTPSYFRSLLMSPRRRFNIEVFYGAELNILDTDGNLDLDSDLAEKLDYTIISMHSQNFQPHSRKENTLAFLRAMQHPNVRILGHADNTHYPIDIDAVSREALNSAVIFEINEASLAPYGYRGDTRENCREILECCKKYGLPVLLSSDSHGPRHVGDFTYAAEFVHGEMFPEELILNNQLPRLKCFLKEGLLG